MKLTIRGKEMNLPAVWWDSGRVAAIDQTLLPRKVKIVRFSDYRNLAKAIDRMTIRGAPTIGAAAAYGIALAKRKGEDVNKVAQMMRGTRPTAHDLFYAIDWMLEHLDNPVESAIRYSEDIIERCRKIGEYGMALIEDGSSILTHCNAGALATVDVGTALAPMRLAHDAGIDFFVFIDETRPRLQGANLTSWELKQEGIDHAIIADNAAGHYLKYEVNLVIVGADRIALNGDTANKIGTYEKAVVARANNIPFYIAAPVSTFDDTIGGERDIPIEHRSEQEVLRFGKETVGPTDAKALNPAFDVTPAEYITGFITEKGILKPSEISEK